MELHFCARIPAIKIDGGNNFGEQINKQPLHNVNPQQKFIITMISCNNTTKNEIEINDINDFY